MTSRLMQPQPAPIPNEDISLWNLVRQDLISLMLNFDPMPLIDDAQERDEFGFQQYGTHLQAHNGRDFDADAYQECLDMVVYLRGWYEECRNVHTWSIYMNSLQLLREIYDVSHKLEKAS
jgi:hypothetical protein